MAFQYLILMRQRGFNPQSCPKPQLNRDFNNPSGDNAYRKDAEITLSGTTAVAAFNNKADTAVALTYTADLQSEINAKSSDVSNILQTVAQLAESSFLAGFNSPQSSDLKDILGAGNYTNASYMAGSLTVTPTMNRTSRSGANSTSIQSGTTYHGAYMDFKDISNLKSLAGSGFDSTCATCNDHYSIKFVNSLAGVSGAQQDSNGTWYSYERSGQDYLLTIDVASMEANGVTKDGSGGTRTFADAMVDLIHDANYNFHYTQYVSDGTKLWLIDERPTNIDPTKADFYTVPMTSNTVGNLSAKFTNPSSSSDPSYIDVKYTYDYDVGVKRYPLNL